MRRSRRPCDDPVSEAPCLWQIRTSVATWAWGLTKVTVPFEANLRGCSEPRIARIAVRVRDRQDDGGVPQLARLLTAHTCSHDGLPAVGSVR